MGDTNELMEFLSASLGATLDEIYQRLIDCDFTREDPGLAMFVVALLNALGREGRGNRPTEVVLMLAFGESGTAERGRNRLMRWRRGEMSGHDLAREPGLGEQRDHRLGEMPLPVQPAQPLIGAKRQRDGPGPSHSVDSPTAAPPLKKVRVSEIEIQTSETIETLEKKEKDQSELCAKLQEYRAIARERDEWKKKFEDLQVAYKEDEIKHLKELYMAKVSQVSPEVLASMRSSEGSNDTRPRTTAQELCASRGPEVLDLRASRGPKAPQQTRPSASSQRFTIPDPSDTYLAPQFQESFNQVARAAMDEINRGTERTLVRIVPSQRRDHSSNSSERTTRTIACSAPGGVFAKSRVVDIRKNLMARHQFTQVPAEHPRACLNDMSWNPATNDQVIPPGSRHLIIGDSLVRDLNEIFVYGQTTILSFGGASVAQVIKMMEFQSEDHLDTLIIMLGTNDVSRAPVTPENKWEPLLVCLLNELKEKYRPKPKPDADDDELMNQDDNDDGTGSKTEKLGETDLGALERDLLEYRFSEDDDGEVDGSLLLMAPSSFMSPTKEASADLSPMDPISQARECRSRDPQKLLHESPRRRKIEESMKISFLSTLPEEEWERYQMELEGKTGAAWSRVNFMEKSWDVIRPYGTQSIMKVGLNQPIMREVLEKIVSSMESDVLTESVTEDSADDQHVAKKLPVRRARKGLKRLKGKTGSRAMNPRVVKSRASAVVTSLTSAGRSGESEQGDSATLTGGEKENLIPPMLLAGLTITATRSKKTARTLADTKFEMEIISQCGSGGLEDYRPSRINMAKLKLEGQLDVVEYSRITVPESVHMGDPAGGYVEMLKARNSARGHLMAWSEKRAMQEYLKGLTENSNFNRKEYGTVMSSEANEVGLEKLLEVSWRAALQKYFDETMHAPATVAAYLAHPCTRTDLQVRLAWCLMGIKKAEYEASNDSR